MKKLATFIATLIFAVIFICPPAIFADPAAQNQPGAKSTPPPGVGIAQTISTITGVAISPLLGVSAVGCYQWCQARGDGQKEAKLPWFANPLFWVPAFLLVLACFVKDTAGTLLPTILKKPFDVADTVEHKISGLVATGAFVPIMVNLIHEANSNGGQPAASLSSLGFAAMDFHWLYDALVTPIAMLAFFVVFLASNAINILILLSPFTTVDLALKSFRTTILASLTVSAFANPWLGAAWALIIIVISYFIAGWSFRLSYFGLVFIWDMFTGHKSRFTPDPKANKIFLGRKIEKVPARTYGKLLRDERGNLILSYHPWLVLPQRTLVLPAGNYEAGRGLFYSEILRVEGGSAKTMILLPPRYRGHEEEMAKIYKFAGVRDVGIRAAWAWFKSMFTGTKTAKA